jgi:GH15 family glucan-1,4-alpha-glucosidase
MDDLAVLQSLQLDNGLFLAAPNCGHEKIMIRDNIYVAEAFEALEDWTTVRRIYWSLLNLLHRNSWKIDWALWQRPQWGLELLHPHYPPPGDVPSESWGFRQNDAIGLLLYKLAVLEKAGTGLLRSHADLHLLQKLVWYLHRLEYWQDADSGTWEEVAEVHASSIGACLRAVQELDGLVHIPDGMREHGWEALHRLLPRESTAKGCDLAQLALIYPLGFREPGLVEQVEEELLRTHGVIRYADDGYHRGASEAQWTMGIPWLGLCWLQLGDRERARLYYERLDRLYWGDHLPECYRDCRPCERRPLAWAHSLALALRALLDRA